MNKLIIFLFLLAPLALTASNSVEAAKGKSGIELFLQDYDWDSMWAEITMTPEITVCKIRDTNDGLFSPYIATITEPLYLAGVSIVKGEIKAFSAKMASDAAKTGTNTDDGGVYVNIIKFPLMNMILGNTSRGALAFDKSAIKPVYLGQFDPKKWDNVMALDLTPEKKLFASVSAQLASVVSCLASAALDLTTGQANRTSDSASILKDIVDNFFFATGCLGPIPTGTSTVHQDAIANGILAINSIFYDMFSRRGAVADLTAKHTTRNSLNNHTKDILCKEVISPFYPQSAYTAQLLFPTTGKKHELGVSPAQYNFYGAGESEKSVFFVINQRRDYAAFAYQD
ncbi:MAG: TraU family protein [Sulfurimonas sp.]|nr:TraU family protein [Sulfurimonas sp.]